MQDPAWEAKLQDFDRHLTQLAQADGIELDWDERRALFQQSMDNGFTPAATVAAFSEFVTDDVDDDDFDPEDFVEPDPVVFEEPDPEPDPVPDWGSMSRQEIDDTMVERVQANQPDPDEGRVFRMDNRQDVDDWMVARVQGQEFDDLTPED